MSSYLNSVKKEFELYKSLGEKTFQQLTDEQLRWQYNSESNSIAIIVKHMWGNMLSRWTDFLTTDGEKPNRNREAEFDNDILNKEELLQKWNDGWTCLFDAIDPLKEEDLSTIVYIRNEPHTVTQAINRQVAHYAYHVGQIVYVGRTILGPQWKSLSIPRGGTTTFNEEMFKRKI